MLLTSIFFFPNNVFKSIFSQDCKKSALWNKGHGATKENKEAIPLEILPSQTLQKLMTTLASETDKM